MFDWLGSLGGDLGGQLLAWVLPSLATIIGGYLVTVLHAQAARIGIEVTAGQDAAIKEAVRVAVLAVEELARRQPLSSREKATLATTKLRQSLPQVSPAHLEELIDATLPTIRAQHPPADAVVDAGRPGGGRR